LAVGLQDSSSRILHNNHIYILNVVMACILSCQLLRSLLWLLYVLVRSWQLKSVWKRRRARSVTIFLVEIIAQMASAFLPKKVLEYCLLKFLFLHICIGPSMEAGLFTHVVMSISIVQTYLQACKVRAY